MIVPQVNLVLMPALQTTVPTGASVQPEKLLNGPLDGLESNHGPWIQ